MRRVRVCIVERELLAVALRNDLDFYICFVVAGAHSDLQAKTCGNSGHMVLQKFQRGIIELRCSHMSSLPSPRRRRLDRSQRCTSNIRITAVTNAGTQRAAPRVTRVRAENLSSLSSHTSKILKSASISWSFAASMQRETLTAIYHRSDCCGTRLDS